MNSFNAFVEDLIEPIAALPKRKQSMREELLGHLIAAAEEGKTQGLSDSAAAAHAIARMGDVATLRASLQASVHPVERYFQTSLAGRVPGESDLHFALRISTLICTGLLAIMFVPVILGALAMLVARGPNAEVLRRVFTVMPIVIIGFGFASTIVFSANVIDLYLQRAIEAHRRAKAAVLALFFVVLCAMLWHAMAMAMMAQVRWLGTLRGDLYLSTLGLAALGAVAMAFDFRRRWHNAAE